MNAPSPPTTRRAVLKAAAAAAAGVGLFHIVPRAALGGPDATAANDRLRVAVVGVGGKGGGHFRSLAHEASVAMVAACDPFIDRAERHARSSGRGCKAYTDYREMLAADRPDAVVIGTPDHWHAKIAIDAMRLGCDVYCEKPLTLTIAEGRAIADTAQRYGRIFQTGSQQRSGWSFLHACELVRNGYIGAVKEVHAAVGGPSRPCVLPGQAVPNGFDYGLWLGPAPQAPYHPHRVGGVFGLGGRGWRTYRDYSGGMTTDWGAHHFDIAQWGLDRDDTGPVEVLPPGHGGDRRLRFRYADGVTLYRGRGPHRGQVQFIGTDGWVGCSRGPFFASDPRFAKLRIGPGDTQLYRSNNHLGNWLDCIRTRRPPICTAEIGHRSVTVCHLGNLAIWLNRPLRWDPAAEAFVGDDEADRMRDRAKREPFGV